MALWLFLVAAFERFGVVLASPLDPWYFAAVGAISFLPAEQIAAILRAYGHAVTGPVCGVAAMATASDGVRSVPWVYLAFPSVECPVSFLPYALEHELRHAWEWLINARTVWPGH